MSFELIILGCGSATPTSKRNPTAQLLKMRERFFLIDCGEGTQIQLRRFKVKFSRINHIFISHLHGDHYFGLPGLLSSFHLLNRTKELHLYGPPELESVLKTIFEASSTKLVYPLIFHPVDQSKKQLLFEDNKVQVHSFPLKHSIPVSGFLFSEKQGERNIIKSKLEEYKIEVCDIQNIKNGNDWTSPSGNVIPNEILTKDPPKPLSYAFCTDTAYRRNLSEFVKNVDLIYHESTFLDSDKDKAKKTNHSTARQAAISASETGSLNLLLGHYSTRYDSKKVFLEEAKQFFQNVYLSEDGEHFIVDQSGINVKSIS